MLTECHPVQAVEVDRILFNHASFRLFRPFDSQDAPCVAHDLVPDRRIFGIREPSGQIVDVPDPGSLGIARAFALLKPSQASMATNANRTA
jgi:hypothetical protein